MILISFVLKLSRFESAFSSKISTKKKSPGDGDSCINTSAASIYSEPLPVSTYAKQRGVVILKNKLLWVFLDAQRGRVWKL